MHVEKKYITFKQRGIIPPGWIHPNQTNARNRTDGQPCRCLWADSPITGVTDQARYGECVWALVFCTLGWLRQWVSQQVILSLSKQVAMELTWLKWSHWAWRRRSVAFSSAAETPASAPLHIRLSDPGLGLMPPGALFGDVMCQSILPKHTSEPLPRCYRNWVWHKIKESLSGPVEFMPINQSINRSMDKLINKFFQVFLEVRNASSRFPWLVYRCQI